MTWQDTVNALFELGGGFLVFLHCCKAYEDKCIRGASTIATACFTAWGFWNLYYYPHLDQWASFLGGILIVIANLIWLSLMIRYRNA